MKNKDKKRKTKITRNPAYHTEPLFTQQTCLVCLLFPQRCSRFWTYSDAKTKPLLLQIYIFDRGRHKINK